MLSSKHQERQGQSIVELIVGISLIAIIAGIVASTIAVVLRTNTQAKKLQTAVLLAKELSDNLRSFADSDWSNIGSLNHGSQNHYYLNTASSPFSANTGDETVTTEGLSFTRYFYVENVNRDLCGAGNITTGSATACASGPGTSGVANDPSTKKVTIIVSWPETTSGITLVEYLTRWRNNSLIQSDWSGGGGQEGPITAANNRFASSTNVDFSGTAGSLQLAGPPYPSSGDLYSSVFDVGQ